MDIRTRQRLVHWYHVCMALVLSAVPLAGCEDVIKVELNRNDPRIIIEGNISGIGRSYFAISRSVDFYDPGIPIGVSGARVIVQTKYGADTASERPGTPGIYEDLYVAGHLGDTVAAEVTVDDVTYHAISVVPRPIEIDSISLKYQPGGGLGPEEDEGYRLHVHFTDTPNYSDYARLKIYRNGRLFDDYNLYDGKFSDGNEIDYSYFNHTLQLGDDVGIELWSMSRPLYDYFKTLYEVTVDDDGTDVFDITPANPNSNWDNDALGYFGVVLIDYRAYHIGELPSDAIDHHVTPELTSQTDNGHSHDAH